MLPEVIFFSETDDSCRIHTDLLCPDIKRFVVLFINRNPKLIDRHFHDLGAKFPCPCGRFMLKVIAEREVTEHFKICAVTCRYADSFNIGCTDTFLASGHSFSWRGQLACKVLFQRCHTGVNQKQAFVSLRHKREARRTKMSLAFEKRKILFSDFVQSHPLHCYHFLSAT